MPHHPPASHPRHPLATKARVLLSSVFGPYGQDDEYGSRTMNPMELYHNQVTRVQGPFSLRIFHRSWGLMFIQSNLETPCTLLDFPTLDRFIGEIRGHRYDVVGISGIVPNLAKVRKMCELVREHLPRATIAVGGHIANIADLGQRIDADHIVRGEGVRWFREFLGEDTNRPLRHPQVLAGIGARALGLTLKEKPLDVAAVVIPSVGCPVGCNFCSTSAMFGGKGHSVRFYRTGDELFEIMVQLEANMKVQSFFMMDENFLLDRPRAMRLLELMERHGKPWALYVFSSAGVLRSYRIEELVRLGISWLWLGLEGKDSQYTKLRGADPPDLVRELQSHGIRVLGSTIIGLENHTPQNIDDTLYQAEVASAQAQQESAEASVRRAHENGQADRNQHRGKPETERDQQSKAETGAADRERDHKNDQGLGAGNNSRGDPQGKQASPGRVRMFMIVSVIVMVAMTVSMQPGAEKPQPHAENERAAGK